MGWGLRIDRVQSPSPGLTLTIFFNNNNNKNNNVPFSIRLILIDSNGPIYNLERNFGLVTKHAPAISL